MTDKLIIAGEMYHIFKHYTVKADAKAYAEVARRAGLFKHIRVQELPKNHPLHGGGKYVLAVRGVVRDVSKLTAASLMKEIKAPKTLEYSKRTGKIKGW
jgi:hypothetical protein